MAVGDFVEDFATRVPTVDIRDALNPLREKKRAPIIANAPRAQTSLQNKYSGYYRDMQASGVYDDVSLKAMEDYDRGRVARGQAPLNEQDTQRALEAASKNAPVTEKPDKSLWNLPGNALSNVGDIVQAIPMLPKAMLEEVQDLGNIGEHLAGDEGNALSRLASAPGVRMLPGAYTVENLAQGNVGELIRNPVITAMDLIPFGSQAAKAGKVGKAAAELKSGLASGKITAGSQKMFDEGLVDMTLRDAKQAEKVARRPIAGVMNNTLDVDGNLIRTPLGEFVDQATDNRMMRPLKQWFSQGERDVMYQVNSAGQRVHNIVRGIQHGGEVVDDLSQEAFALRDKLEALDPELISDPARIPAITDALDGKTQWSDLSPVDQAAAEMYRDLMTRVTSWQLEQNYQSLFNGEIYEFGQGTELRQGAQAIKEAEGINTSRQYLIGGVTDPTATLDDLLATRDRSLGTYEKKRGTPAERTKARAADLDTGAITRSNLKRQTDTVIRAMESSGFDTDRLYAKTVNAKGKTTRKLLKDDELTTALRDLRANPGVPSPIRSMDDVAATLKAAKAKYKGDSLSIVENAIKNDNWVGSAHAIDNLSKSAIPELADPELLRAIRNQRDNSRTLAKTKRFNDDAIAKKKIAHEKAKAKATPARFMPEAERRTKAAVKQRLIDTTDPAILAETLRLADTNQWSQIPGFDESMYRTIQREQAMQWQSWRDQGFDPVFVHTVPPNKLSRVLYPSDTIVPRKPSSENLRRLDMSPGARDFSVAVNDQMMEYLARRETETAVKYIMDMKGESESSLRARYMQTAEARALRAPVKDAEGHLMDLMNENFKRFDPIEEGYGWGSPYLDKLKQDDMWIPKSTYANLKSLADPRSVAGGIFDPVTKAFRIAVVGLSLRTQIYNVVGGAVSAELQAPGSLMRQGKKAIEATRHMSETGLWPDWMDGELKEMLGSNKQSMLQLDDIQQGKVSEGISNYMKGKKLGGWWDDIQAKKTPGQSITQRYGGKVTGLAEKLYTINGVMDDMYRMVSYFDEFDQNIKKGASKAKAAEAAIGQTRRVLQDWMGMTPMERGVMKSIVPFYGFMSHAMRFVFQYPMDHPLRAEIITKLAMAEMEDQEGLPSRFLSSLFFGEQDENGNQSAFNLAPMNPFGDVANMLTISGMLGATNPAISTAMEMVGLDQGQSELYPSLRYDPETGRLGAKHSNPLLALAENTIPQSGLVTTMLGMNERFNEALQRDPAAANRMLLSNMTVPILWRQYNTEQEQFKAEIARSDAADIVKKEALKTGDWNEAMRYPSLREYLAALDTIPDDQLSPFHAGQKDAIANLQTAALQGGSVALPTVATVDEQVAAILAGQPGQIAAFSAGTARPGSTPSTPATSSSLGVSTGGI